MKELFTYPPAVGLKHIVRFVAACIKYIVDDTISSECLQSTTLAKYVLCIQLVNRLLGNAELILLSK